MRHLSWWWWCAAACAALGDAPPPRYEVPKVAVAEALLAGDGNGPELLLGLVALVG